MSNRVQDKGAKIKIKRAKKKRGRESKEFIVGGTGRVSRGAGKNKGSIGEVDVG